MICMIFVLELNEDDIHILERDGGPRGDLFISFEDELNQDCVFGWTPERNFIIHFK